VFKYSLRVNNQAVAGLCLEQLWQELANSCTFWEYPEGERLNEYTKSYAPDPIKRIARIKRIRAMCWVFLFCFKQYRISLPWHWTVQHKHDEIHFPFYTKFLTRRTHFAVKIQLKVAHFKWQATWVTDRRRCHKD